MTHEEILKKLDRIANGDDYNDPESLVNNLKWLASEAELLIPKKDIS
jgi:hypothetical protein